MKAASKKNSTSTAKSSTSLLDKGGAPSFFQTTTGSPFYGKSNYGNAPIQAKLNVGKPNDKYEKEADAVADNVVQRLAVPEKSTAAERGIQAKPIGSAISPLVQTKCAACEQEEKLQKKEEGLEENMPSLMRKAIFESNEESENKPSIQRKCHHCKMEEKGLQRKETANAATTASPSVESNLSHSKGSGTPLSASVNSSMSNAFGADFSKVRVHTDSTATQMSRQLNAQAFTHGSDIYFNSGKFDTTSRSGQHLLAHELTHTVQQAGAIANCTKNKSNDSTIHKSDDPVSKPTATPEGFAKQEGGKVEIHLTQFPLKQYASTFNLGNNILMPNTKRETNQKEIWKDATKNHVEKFITDFIDKKNLKTEPLLMLTLLKNPEAKIIGEKDQLKNEIAVPFWDKGGNPVIHQVEHSIDWQILGKAADHIDNMVLLDKRSNLSLGNSVNQDINSRLKIIFDNYKSEFSELDGLEPYKSRKSKKIAIYFDTFAPQIQTPTGSIISKSNLGGTNEPYKQEFFDLQIANIPKGKFLLRTNKDRAGYLLPYSPNGNIVGRFSMITEGEPKLTSIYLYPIVEGGKDVLVQDKDKKKNKIANEDDKENVFLTNSKALALRLRDFIGVKDFSPIIFSEPEITPGFGLKISGIVDTDIPFLKDNGVEIGFELIDSQFIISASIGDIIKFPKPFNVTYSSLFIKASSKEGLFIGGELQFGINKLGKGKLTAIKGASGFAVTGLFEFDSKKFEGSNFTFSYKDKKWSIGGELKVGKDKFSGIKDASLAIKYASEKITANGSANLDVPGIDSVTLNAEFDDAGNFKATAKTALKKVTGIKSGNIDVTISKEKDDFQMIIDGKASPDLPKMPKELSTELSFKYDSKTDVFNAGAHFTYTKGKVSVDINAGVTNAAVVDGVLQQKKGNGLIFYGDGKIKVTLIENKVTGEFKATVKPGGELFVSGKAEVLPTPLMPPFNKEKLIPFPSLKIPVIGVPFVSIFLEIGGGVKFYFNWEPLSISGNVTLPDTDITKLAQATVGLNITADSTATAGAGMQISAKVGAEALVVEVSGGVNGFAGLEVTGKVGAGLNMEFNLEKGLVLKDMNAKIEVTPKAKFSLEGVIGVYLNLFFDKINVWEWKKKLAEGSIDLSNLGGLEVTVPVKFDQAGKVILPGIDSINVKKPEFNAQKGKDLMDSVFNDKQKSKADQEEENKARIRASIGKDLRSRLGVNESHDLFLHAKDVQNKWTKSKDVKLAMFIIETIENELKFIAGEVFDTLKNDIRVSKEPLSSKLQRIDEYDRQWEPFRDKTLSPILREEVQEAEKKNTTVQKKEINSESILPVPSIQLNPADTIAPPLPASDQNTDKTVVSSQAKVSDPDLNVSDPDRGMDKSVDGKIGIINWDKAPKVKLRKEPDTTHEESIIENLEFNTHLTLIGSLATGWYKVISPLKNIGYVSQIYVTTSITDNETLLHRVESGVSGYALAIAEKYYKSILLPGLDMRDYVELLGYVNFGSFLSGGWKQVHFNGGALIKIPGVSYAQQFLAAKKGYDLKSKIFSQFYIPYYGILLSDYLARYLFQLLKASESNYELVLNIMKDLDDDHEDDVGSVLIKLCTQQVYPDRKNTKFSYLDRMLTNPTGKVLADYLYYAVATGFIGESDESAAISILSAQTAQMPLEKVIEGMSDPMIFPLKQTGITVINPAPLSAKRLPDGKIVPDYPSAVGYDYKEDISNIERHGRGSPLVGQIKLDPDEIVGVKLYDEGEEIHYIPARGLIMYSNKTTTETIKKIGEVSALALGGFGGAAVEGAGWFSKTLLWADRIAGTIGVISQIVNEHRGWIIKNFPDHGRQFLEILNKVNAIASIYSVGRLVGGLGYASIKALRAKRASWIAEAKMKGISGNKIVEELDQNAQNLIEAAEEGRLKIVENNAGHPYKNLTDEELENLVKAGDETAIAESISRSKAKDFNTEEEFLEFSKQRKSTELDIVDAKLELELAKKGGSRKELVGDPDFDEEILFNGHSWKKNKNSPNKWCRFSDGELCFIFGETDGISIKYFGRKGEVVDIPDELKRNMGNPPGDGKGWQAHHIIPYELRNHPVIDFLRRKFNSKWNINDAKNGIWLPVRRDVVGAGNKALHRGSHEFYSGVVETRLDELNYKWTRNIINDDQLLQEVMDLQARYHMLLDNGSLALAK